MRALQIAASVVVAALAACSGDFTPRSVLTDLRVLAIEASPLEVGPDEEVTVAAEVYVPPGVELVEERWTFCPFSVGASEAYACAVDCEVPLAGAMPTFAPGTLARDCVTKLLGSATPPATLPSQVPDVVSTVVRYVATTHDTRDPTTTVVVTRETVARIPLYTAGPPAARNHPPTIQLVSIGSMGLSLSRPPAPPPEPIVLQRGAELEFRVRLTDDSAESYGDSAGAIVSEAPVVSFFTTDGRFDYDRGSGPDASVKLKYEEVAHPAGKAQLWAVASDLRGGVAVVGPYEVTLAP